MQAIDSAPPNGLTTAEADVRLASAGPNDVGVARRDSNAVQQILVALANPLILLLLAAGAVSAALGQVVNATLIASMVLLSVSLNFVQTFRSQRAVESLRRGVAPTAMALRDGSWSRIPRRNLVVEDRVRLAAGDLVPADATLLLAKDLHVQEAALTGESLPAEKNASGSGEDRQVFLGTSIVSGSAEAIVTATGRATRFGEIAARLSARPPETEFERGTRRFGFLIMRTVLFLILFVLLVNVLLHRDPLQSLLFAVALAVGLTPEFLPMITSVTLARGAVRMARRKVIVKHLEAIQNFGSIDILCSDKTGTLTSGEMALERLLRLGGGQALGACWRSPATTAPCRPASSSPLDAALLAAPAPDGDAARKLDEVPFDFERRRLSVVVERAETASPDHEGRAGERAAAVRVVGDRRRRGAGPFDSARARARAKRSTASLSERGLRVIAVAWREVPPQAAYGAADERELTLAGFRGLLGSRPARTRARMIESAPARRRRDQDPDRRQRARRAPRLSTRWAWRTSVSSSGTEVDAMTDAALAAVAERVLGLRPGLAGAEEPDPPRAEDAGPRRGLSRRRHQRRPVAARRRRRDLGRRRASTSRARRPTSSCSSEACASSTTGSVEGRKSFGNVMKYLLMGTSSNFGNMFSMAAASLFLPFLPMLPTQILLNNFLYDLAQVTIPTDRVDPSFIRKPQRWHIDVVRDFMIAIGPVSSVFDFLTFCVLLRVFHASSAFFHTGWFVESLATQALVLFVIRTAGNPFRSRPSRPARRHDGRRRRDRRDPSVHAGGGGARLRAATREFLRLPGGYRGLLSRLRRDGEAPAPAQPSDVAP